MAVSVSNVLAVPYRISGNQRKTVYDVTFGSSYASEGEPLPQKELGLNKIEYSEVMLTAGSESSTLRPTNGYYTPSTEKIHLIDSATGKEVEATKDMSKVVARVTSYGW